MISPIPNVSLKDHSTMRLGGNAQYLVEVNNADELIEAVGWAKERSLPTILIGTGSNIVWGDKGFDGLVMVNKILGFHIAPKDSETAVLTVGSGENWDDVVRRTVQLGYSELAQLSLIPGTSGATPVQNVGAYGREISEILSSVDAYDLQSEQNITIDTIDCDFGYRTSRFKTTDRGRFLITSLAITLTHTKPKPPFYASLQEYLDQNDVTNYTPQAIRDAVIAIRSSKLPDPAVVANNGSFFQNPVVEAAKADALKQKFPDIKLWSSAEKQTKISAAWLVEQAGFKDVHDPKTGMATWAKQPLVLVNEHAKNTADLLDFKQQIVDAVKLKFDIELVQEPEFIEM